MGRSRTREIPERTTDAEHCPLRDCPIPNIEKLTDHLNDCLDCWIHRNGLDRLHEVLRSGSGEPASVELLHPSPTVMAVAMDLTLDESPSSAVLAAARHIASCPRCKTEIEALRYFDRMNDEYRS